MNSSEAELLKSTPPNCTQDGQRLRVAPNWSDLSPGDAVVLLGLSEERFAGTVDAIGLDGETLWMFLERGAGRRLFHSSDASVTLVGPY